VAAEFRGELLFDNVTVRLNLFVDSSSNFYLGGNLSLGSETLEFVGVLTRGFTVLSDANRMLNITDDTTGESVVSVMTDGFGRADFEVTFTSANFADVFLINDEKAFNLTSTTPIVYG
jgi:hypothetical protein